MFSKWRVIKHGYVRKNDLLKETMGGVGVFLAIFIRFFGSDNFKLPTLCRLEGVEFGCFKGANDHPKTPLAYPQTHLPYLKELY